MSFSQPQIRSSEKTGEHSDEGTSSLRSLEFWLHRSGTTPPPILKYSVHREIWWSERAYMYALFSNGLEASRAMGECKLSI